MELKEISIIICSYNRAEILMEVLHHFYNKVVGAEEVEFLVIDNNSSDNTANVVNTFSQLKNKMKYHLEENQGLSHARNRGILESQGKYVLFLDDDALADEKILLNIKRALEEKSDINCLGGCYLPWYKYGKPKWYKDEYASNIFKKEGLIAVDEDDEPTGGVLLIKKDVFQKIGTFNTSLGMKGNTTFYGEENELFARMRKKNIITYGDNRIIIFHVVQAYKLSVAWFFKEKKALAKSLLLQTENKNSLRSKGYLVCVPQALLLSLFNLPKLLSKDYFIQNFIIDSYTKPWKWLQIALG